MAPSLCEVKASLWRSGPKDHRDHSCEYQVFLMARLTRTQYCRTALRAQTSILDSSSAIVSIMCARCVSDSAIRPPPSGLGVRMRGVEAARLPARLFLTGMLKRPMSSAAVPEATVERVTHGMVRRAGESVGEERVDAVCRRQMWGQGKGPRPDFMQKRPKWASVPSNHNHVSTIRTSGQAACACLKNSGYQVPIPSAKLE